MISGRTVEDVAAGKPAQKPADEREDAAPAKAGATPCPGFVPPALATLEPKPPRGDGWVHEIKFDGYRLQARIAAAR